LYRFGHRLIHNCVRHALHGHRRNTEEVLFSFLLITAEGQSAANYQKRGKATGARGFKFFVRTGMSCE
jgi:hypothetical protein